MGDKSAFVGGMKLKISELGKVITGNTPSKKIKEFWDKDDVGFVKPDIISDEHIVKIKSEDCNEFISNAAISKARIVPKNSIFVTCIGNIGKIGVATENLAFNQQINAIIPNENVNLDYLCYAIFANKTRLQDIANAPIVPLLNKSQFSEFELEFDMDINTQTRIVHELNTVSNIILKYKQELLLLDELVRARFVEMFGDPVDNPMNWKKRKLKDLVTEDCTISYGIVQTGEDQKEGVPVIRPIDIVNHIPKVVELKKTTELISDRYKKTLLKGHELLITVRANIADTFIADEEYKGCNVGRGIVPIRTQEDIIRLEFLKCLIDNKHLNDILKSKAKGITLIQLNMEDLRNVELIIPPIDLQIDYLKYSRLIDKSRLHEQLSIEYIKLLLKDYYP